MGDARLEVTAAVKELIQANLTAREQLEENERLLRSALASIEGGASIETTLRAMPTIEERAANSEAVRSFYERRIDLRTATIKAALDEGMTVTDLAAVFGIPYEVIASHVARSAVESDP